MKTNLKEINSYTRQLDVTITWNLIEKDYQVEFNRARSRYSMPGFRKGKVPVTIVKKNLGLSIDANFAENSINTYYRKALDELQITPINKASIDNLNFKEGLDLSFTAHFEVHPEVNLPKFKKKFKIKVVRYLPEDVDVEQALTNYQEQHAMIKTVESGAKSGNFIQGDFQIIDKSGLPVSGSKLEDQYIRLGFGMFKETAEKVFLGAKEGDEVEVTIQGKDKPLNYQVKVNRVEEQILPELDNELAKTINANFNTLEELKIQVKDDLQASLDKDHKELIRKEIINYFIDNSKVDAPESMVSIYLNQIKEDLIKQNQQFEEKELKENYKSHAEWNIKWYLIKDQIIKEEAIDVTDEEMKSKIDEMIIQNKENEDKIRAFIKESKNKQNLYNEILNDKLFDHLSDYVKVMVVEQSTNELRKKQAA
jgi:trigger factor